MSNLIDTIEKLKKKNVFVVVDFPSLEEITTKHSIFIRKFGIEPEYITFDPDIWILLRTDPKIFGFVSNHDVERLLGMQVVVISDIDTMMFPFDEKLQRVLNRK